MENLSEKNSEILTLEEKNKILHDLFEWEEWELDASFLYKWKWAELYEKISLDESYPFINIENECLEGLRRNEKFIKILKNIDYITDIGSGDGQKIVALLWSPWPYRDRPYVPWEGTYIPEDYSWQMLDIAVQNVRKHLPHIKLWSSQKLNTWKHLTQHLSNNMYLFLWGTICNMTDREIVEELKRMDNDWLIEWNYILLSYFTAPNTEEEIKKLEQIYKSDANKAFHENGMEMLWFSKDDFEYDAVYEKDDPSQKEWPFPWKIKWIIKAQRDMAVKINDWRREREIQIKKWDKFTLHYSRRFTKEWIKELFDKSGCKAVFSDEINWDSIVLLKRKPGNLWKVRKMVMKAVWATLIVGATAFATSKHIEHKKQQERDKAYTEREATQSSNPEWTLYLEETNELIIALWLDELKDDNVKQTIIDLFNIYVWNHKNDWFTNPELIQWFWQEYWWMFIKDFKLSHSPYDFMDTDTIELTNNIPDELVFTPDYRFGNKVSSKHLYNDYWAFQWDTHYVKSRHGKALRYNDNWKPYIIIKAHVYIGNTKTFIYLATDEVNKHYPYFSTDMVKKIQDQSWLDPEILSNTNNLKHDLTFENRVDFTGVAYPTDHIVRLINTNEDQVVMMNERMKKSPSASWGTILLTPKTVYLENWGLYYVITVATKSGKKIWLASKSLDEPFTTTKFNKLSKEFSKVRGVGYDKTIYITKKPA